MAALCVFVWLDIHRQRQAKDFIDVLRPLKVGTTTGSEVLLLVRRFDPESYVRQPKPDGINVDLVSVPTTQCESGDCELSFGPKEPAPLEWLGPILWDHPLMRKWFSASGFWANLSIEGGVLKEVSVFMHSVQVEDVKEVRMVYSSENVLTPWNIERYTAHNTGGPTGARTTDFLAVSLGPSTSEERQKWAFGFDESCVRLRRHCSVCEVLPHICRDYEKGDWDYFNMSGTVLESYKDAVNKLPFGITQEQLVQQLGDDAEWRLPKFRVDRHVDRLPLQFPSGTIYARAQEITYLLRKHRQTDLPGSFNTVTFIFDSPSSGSRLIEISSRTPGILSRRQTTARR